jgi:PAS domain S-box-containing protein
VGERRLAPDGLKRLWFVWWSGDALGDVLVAPLLLTWARAARPAARRLEAGGLLAALLLLTALLLRNPLSYVYAVFPVIVWAALRFGSRGTATATAVVAALTIWYTLRGLGPFVESTPTENLALLQTFLALTAVTGLVLAAATSERGAARDAAQESEQRFRMLVESVRDYAIFSLDASGHIVSWNAGAEHIKGYTAGEIIGRHFATFYTAPDVAAGQPQANLRDAAERGRCRTEGWRIRKDGSPFWADVTITPVRDERGALLGFAKVTRDLSERRMAEQALRREAAFLRLLQVVAVAANEAQSAEPALRTTIDHVCRETGWPVGHVYVVTPDEPDVLHSTTIWHDQGSPQYAPFRRLTERTTLRRGVGLPGRVLTTKRATWVLDVTRDENFPRANAATESGLRAGIAIPVLVGPNVVAVLEFFSPEAIAPDEALLGVLTQIGTQLGRVIERERAAEALREREALLGAMFDQSAVGIVVADRSGRFFRSNRAFQDMIGYDAAELRSLSHVDITYAEDLRHNRDLIAELVRGTRSSSTFERRYCRKDGRTIWAHVTVSALPAADGTQQRFVGMVEDVTDRKTAEAELERHRAQLRGLAARLEAAREAERARIAREIHDELGQALTALKIDLLWLKKRIPESSPELVHKLDGMAAIMDSTAQGIQQVAAELRPSVLDELGLRAAIEWEAREFATRTGIECRVELPKEQPRLDPSRATAVFRIFQEALTNVARHAAATHVRVRLGVTPKAVELTVQDNGRGIRDGALGDSRSLGLLGMRERASNFDGNVTIAGTTGAGTTLTLTMPRGA